MKARRLNFGTFASLAGALLFGASPALGDHFAEGYSSVAPDVPAELRFRAFTLDSMREACSSLATPSRLRIQPDPLLLKVGDRIHRSNASESAGELVIEAYGADGRFLPRVPVMVATAGETGVTDARSDWDYFEAMRAGEGELIVSSPCAAVNDIAIEAKVRIIVSARKKTGEA